MHLLINHAHPESSVERLPLWEQKKPSCFSRDLHEQKHPEIAREFYP
jgi:hypothetical protein